MTAVYFACLPGTKWDGCLFCLIGPPDWSQINQPVININYSDDPSGKKKKMKSFGVDCRQTGYISAKTWNDSEAKLTNEQ